MYPTMISSWRRRRAARRRAAKLPNPISTDDELIIPNHFLCPISLDMMKDPVTFSTETTYDRDSIETWIETGHTTCPITKRTLTNPEPIPNHTMRKMIQDWCVENRSRGIERIPSPRIPLSSHEVHEILSKLDAAKLGNDEEKCLELVSKIKKSAKDSDRNKRCMAANGTGRVLSAAFDEFSGMGINVALLEDILSALMVIRPSLDGDDETIRNLSTKQSLQSIAWFLRFGSLSGRKNAVLALKSLLTSDQTKVDDVVKIEGALESLVELIKLAICPTTTKASLLAIYHMLMPNKKLIAIRLTEMGLVGTLLEMLVGTERSICEKALGVLDRICNHGEGREKAYANALTVPLLVKKLLRVSDLATELSVSILLKLGKNDNESEGGCGVIVEALEVGAFQKLLLVLQVSSSEVTKEKVTQLLKSLNGCRNRVECIDSLDFKDLKRPF